MRFALPLVVFVVGCVDVEEPTPADLCVAQHADDPTSSDIHGCEPIDGPCDTEDYEVDVRANCEICQDCEAEATTANCDAPFITREAALCITREAGLEPGEWQPVVTLTHNRVHGPIWAVRVLRELSTDRAEGGGDSWYVNAIDGRIVFRGSYAWQDD